MRDTNLELPFARLLIPYRLDDLLLEFNMLLAAKLAGHVPPVWTYLGSSSIEC